jgi:hypothetical protein
VAPASDDASQRLQFLEGGEAADGGGFGERCAVEREAREGVGGLAGDGFGGVAADD